MVAHLVHTQEITFESWPAPTKFVAYSKIKKLK